MIGQLLVAPPAQKSELWGQSVIFIYEETPVSTVGLIVNKPSERRLADLAEHHNLSYDGDELIYVGGPVNPMLL